jgi:hypothetical protein
VGDRPAPHGLAALAGLDPELPTVVEALAGRRRLALERTSLVVGTAGLSTTVVL